MDKFPEEVWVMIFEIVANTILAECTLIDDDGLSWFGEAIKQYPPLLLVCRRFHCLWTRQVRVTGQFLGPKLQELAEHRCIALVTNRPAQNDCWTCGGADEIEISDIKATCGIIWRSSRLETLLQTCFLSRRRLLDVDPGYVIMYSAPLYLKLQRTEEAEGPVSAVYEYRYSNTTKPRIRGQHFTWYSRSLDDEPTRWLEFVVDQFRLGPYRSKCPGGFESAWRGISISYFWDQKESAVVQDTEGEREFKHGRLWLWYERTKPPRDINRYRLVDYKFGIIQDRYLMEAKQISLLEESF
jgi:hypothetical protein